MQGLDSLTGDVIIRHLSLPPRTVLRHRLPVPDQYRNMRHTCHIFHRVECFAGSLASTGPKDIHAGFLLMFTYHGR